MTLNSVKKEIYKIKDATHVQIYYIKEIVDKTIN